MADDAAGSATVDAGQLLAQLADVMETVHLLHDTVTGVRTIAMLINSGAVPAAKLAYELHAHLAAYGENVHALRCMEERLFRLGGLPEEVR